MQQGRNRHSPHDCSSTPVSSLGKGNAVCYSRCWEPNPGCSPRCQPVASRRQGLCPRLHSRPGARPGRSQELRLQTPRPSHLRAGATACCVEDALAGVGALCFAALTPNMPPQQHVIAFGSTIKDQRQMERFCYAGSAAFAVSGLLKFVVSRSPLPTHYFLVTIPLASDECNTQMRKCREIQ